MFPTASVWANGDHEWIMLGIKGSGRRLKEEEIRSLWSDALTSADLKRVGIEEPEQIAALFLMDGLEIERITRDIKPLSDFYPKRLSDAPPDINEARKFAAPYMEATRAFRSFLSSPLIEKIWPEEIKTTLGPFFLFRETRYFSEIMGSNKLAELDLYLRHSHLRAPVLEALRTDEFRLAIAEKIASRSEIPPPEVVPELIAGALAKRDIATAIRLLAQRRERGFAVRNDILLLIYLDCLNGDVPAAEAVAVSDLEMLKKDWFVEWLWGKLQAEFGFRPPV